MTFRWREIGCAFGLLLAGLASGAAADHPAGIILYAEGADGVSLLLADHLPPSQRGWAAFGGMHEQDETPAETAARETEEETNGFFSRTELLARIKNSAPLFDGAYAFYFVKVPMVPIREITKLHLYDGEAAYRERGPFAWVPFSAIERQLAAKSPILDSRYLPADARTNRLWTVWLNNLRVAIEAHALPWAADRTKMKSGVAN